MPIVATYPAATRIYPVRLDLSETIFANDMNEVQVEVVAIENTLGYNPHLSSQGYSPGTSPTVASRLALFEQDAVTRLSRLERLTLNGSESAYVGTAVSVSSSTSWQSLMLTQTDQVTSSNLINNGTIFDNVLGYSRFIATAPDQTAYALSSTLTWAAITGGSPVGAPAGRRGLRVVGSDGRIHASYRYPATVGDTGADVMSLHWTGVLPVTNPQYSLSLQVFNDSGEALLLSTDTLTTPGRVDFTRIPG